MPGPLSGYRIIDMTTVIMGPMASMMMGEMGADVIKIESPVGDQTRNYAQGKTPGMGSIYMNLNKNKRSVMLDLKQPAGGRRRWTGWGWAMTRAARSIPS
jgi:crotonobetainyl-CoA:carnitine CoA-transferase CaiB-like acyl-CoA transferase